MSILSDTGILAGIYTKRFSIDPFIIDNIQPSSIDLTLDDNIEIPKQDITINIPYPDREETRKYFNKKTIEGSYILRPGDFILAQIKETLGFSDTLVGSIQNRNSLIRMGINVGLSSYINPGYKGKLPIAIHNLGVFDFHLTPGMRICQLVLNETSVVSKDYSKRENTKYHGEEEITLSRLSEDPEFVEYVNKVGKNTKSSELVSFLKKRAEEKSIAFFDQLSTEQKRAIGLAWP